MPSPEATIVLAAAAHKKRVCRDALAGERPAFSLIWNPGGRKRRGGKRKKRGERVERMVSSLEITVLLPQGRKKERTRGNSGAAPHELRE